MTKPAARPKWMVDAAKLANEETVTIRVERGGAVYTFAPGVHLEPTKGGGNTCDELFGETPT